MNRKFRYPFSKIFLFGLMILPASITWAQPDASWVSATADTQKAINTLQEQAQAEQQKQSMLNDQQRKQLQSSLNTIIHQQRTMLENAKQSVLPLPGTNFQPTPRITRPVIPSQNKDNTQNQQNTNISSNPWLKPNPWSNTKKNPYAGQRYGTQPNNTQNSNQNNSIYLRPNSNNSDSSTQSVDIFK